MSENSWATRDGDTGICREKLFNNDQNFGVFNKVRLSGIIEDNFKYSHQNEYDWYYSATISIPRRSGVEDHIPIIVPQLLIREIWNNPLKGMYAKVTGCIRTNNVSGEDGKKHLKVYVYVKNIEVYESQGEAGDTEYDNFVYLEGRICKSPIFRVTPLGREITDLMLAVKRYNTANTRADYIPCIAWGLIARNASELRIREVIQVYGRMQSREYTKKCSEYPEKSETRVAYEVSIMRME